MQIFSKSRVSPKHSTALAIASAITVFALAGCGGGSSSSSTGVAAPAPTVAISGVAAAGLPLTGTVTVKDAKGATKTVTLGTNGSYSIDVTSMTAPLVFRAEGRAGGNSYVIHSASAVADANGIINITPLTDLIVANIAGQVAANYFNSGNFASLTPAELSNEAAALKAKLLPVLTAAGVDAAVDLLRTPFTPLASSLDAVLDLIRVSVDQATNVATITNISNQLTITDSLAVKAAAETGAAPLASTGATSAAQDISNIRKAFTNFSDLYKTGLPTTAAIKATLSASFLQADEDGTSFANGAAGFSDLVGGQLTNISITRIDYAYNGGATPLAYVTLDVLDKNGASLGYQKNFKALKESDGVWRFHGDQRVLQIGGHVHLFRKNGCTTVGLEFNIEDVNTANSSSINYLLVTGPGLPASGLKYQRPSLGGYFTLTNNVGNVGGQYYRMASDCVGNITAGLNDATITAIPDNVGYTIKAFDSSNAVVQVGTAGTGVYTERMPKRPHTLTEAKALAFPVITTSTPFSSYNGGSLTISATGLIPGYQGEVYLGLTSGQGQLDYVWKDVIPNSAGSGSATITLSTPASVASREIRFSTKDAFDRTIMSGL